MVAIKIDLAIRIISNGLGSIRYSRAISITNSSNSRNVSVDGTIIISSIKGMRIIRNVLAVYDTLTQVLQLSRRTKRVSPV